MAEPSADVCRANARIWEARAAETDLPQLHDSYLKSAAVWIATAERIEHTASLRNARLEAVAAAGAEATTPAG